MKKFYLKLTIFALCLILPFFIAFLYVQSFAATSTGSLMGVSSMKLDLVSAINEEKIVLVGGSNVVYNLTAEDISKEFDMPVFNMGTTAYLGLDFFVTQIKSYAKPGDLIVLSLENSVYSNIVDYQTVWQAIENHENMYKIIPFSYMPQLILNYYHYAQGKLFIHEEYAEIDTKEHGYISAGFNEYGDYTIEHTENILTDLYNKGDTYFINEEIVESSVLNELNSLKRWADTKDIKIYLTYAPFNALAVENENLQDIEDFENYLTQNCSIPWIGSYREGMMDESLFFNSNNHLNSNGKKIRTEDFIKDLHELNIL